MAGVHNAQGTSERRVRNLVFFLSTLALVCTAVAALTPVFKSVEKTGCSCWLIWGCSAPSASGDGREVCAWALHTDADAEGNGSHSIVEVNYLRVLFCGAALMSSLAWIIVLSTCCCRARCAPLMSFCLHGWALVMDAGIAAYMVPRNADLKLEWLVKVEGGDDGASPLPFGIACWAMAVQGVLVGTCCLLSALMRCLHTEKTRQIEDMTTGASMYELRNEICA